MQVYRAFRACAPVYNAAMEKFDVAVIGAGVAGLSTAFFVAQRGARVVVLEREAQPAYHTSGRSAAMYIEGYENRTVSRLTTEGKDFFFAPPAGFTDTPLLDARGGMTVAGPQEDAPFDRYLKEWQPYCPQLEEVSTARALEICPILNPDWLTRAAWDPTWYAIDTHALIMGFQRGVKAAGGVVATGRSVDELRPAGDQWHATCAEITYAAPVVVNAAGAWAADVASLAGLPALPLTPMRRTAAIVPAPDHARAWPLVHTITGNLYFKPESPGLMVSPQDEIPSPPMDAYPEDLDVAVALERFATITTLPVERVLRTWAGLRTFAPDRLPAFGFDPRAAGFFWAAGQGGFGMQTAPGLGRLAAAGIAGETLPADVTVERLL